MPPNGVPTRRGARQPHDRRFLAGRSRPYWWRTRPETAPRASRTKVTCASTSLAKKSLLLSGQSCTAAATGAPAVSMTTTLVSAPKQHIMKVSDVQELIDSLLLVRGTPVVGCRDLVAHPVAQICWSVGTPVPVVEPVAKLSPVHRCSKLRPELFLVALA